ncbi:MAG: hypothetical protein GY702_26225 [Desulfobulbaceae bacterium]|nr:hypothetical protein [Desulfobulbaceae bacterium]
MGVRTTNDKGDPYVFSSDDFAITSAVKELLWKTARSKLSTATQLEVIAQALQIFERLPAEIPILDIQVQITGPRRMFGTHEIYHWWHVEIECEVVTVTSGGHFYRPETGGDSFTAMAWRACPNFATEHYDYLDNLSIVDDAQPFDLEVQSIDFTQDEYVLEVYKDGEDVLDCYEEDEGEGVLYEDEEFLDGLSFSEVVKTLESYGVECVWLDRDCTSLDSIDLQEVELSDSIYRLFLKIQDLQTLDARSTDISDRTLGFIKNIHSLEWLCLRNTTVTAEGLRYLQPLTNLQHLDLINTSILGPGLDHLRAMKNLKGLYVSGFQYHDKWLEMLCRELPQCAIYLN